MKQRSKRIVALVAIAGASIGAAGCGSDDAGSDDSTAATTAAPTVSTTAEPGSSTTANESSDATTTPATDGAPTTAAAGSPLGAPNKATGEPITIGYATTGKNENTDYTYEQTAARATVAYINDYLGGIGGRPIELLTCEDGRAEARIATCINEMLDAKVPLVVTPSTANATLYANSFTEAGVPWVLNQAADPTALTSDGVFVLTDSPAATIDAPSKIVAAEGAERITYLVIDSPGLIASLQAKADAVYDAIGAEVDLIGIPPGTADMTPQVAAALQKDPDEVMIIGNPTFCISGLTALKTNGYTGGVMLIPQCIDGTVNDAVPGGLEGARLLGFGTSDPADPDIVLRDAIYAEYEPDTIIDGYTDGAFQTFLGVQRVLGGITGDITPESVTEAFRNMPPTDLPLGAGITYQCDGQQVPGLTAICGNQALVATFDADGVARDFEVVELAPAG
jgi:branched-chain amino acid transport system substrate-binding protein